VAVWRRRAGPLAGRQRGAPPAEVRGATGQRPARPRRKKTPSPPGRLTPSQPRVGPQKHGAGHAGSAQPPAGGRRAADALPPPRRWEEAAAAAAAGRG